MKRPNWDEYFLQLAYTVASRSECLDKQVGCVVVDKMNRIIGTGYNGFPAGAHNPCVKSCQKEHGKPCGMVHAELNAMLYTDMTRAHKMYVTLPPCDTCLRHIMSTPIVEVVMPTAFARSNKVTNVRAAGLANYARCDYKNNLQSLELGIGIAEAFGRIREYHEVLGYPVKPECSADRYQQFRDIIVALNQEVAELCDSFPWKPWRPIEDQVYDEENAIMEMVDIFIFMGSVLELFEIAPERFEEMLDRKIAENYNRIQRGYNKSKEDM